MLIQLDVDEEIEVEHQPVSRDIAIIGISCTIAKANGKEAYWQVIRQGEDCIRPLPADRAAHNDSYIEYLGIPKDERAYYEGGFLDEIHRFDHELFSISPREASLMSPAQRLFLETAWHVIEDAGYGGQRIKSTKTGMYVGHSTDFGESYKHIIEAIDPSLASVSIPGNLHSIIASRISYLLDLKGPSLMVDTACSSSLAAVHLACQALRNGECEMAIAGSIKVDLLPLASIREKEDELGITSPDGRTRTFDDHSEGTGLGEGTIAVFLKPLARAVADKDSIYAVIKGSAMNQDGSSVGLTAPNAAAQEEVILRAWHDAGVDPETISYMEVHGTGTKLGDPIEISGIERAFRRYTTKRQFCGVGSVKSNIGHLDNAAGLAGLVKAVLCLVHKELPPSLHFDRPNRKISFEQSPVYVNDTLRRWETNGFPRRCGVSAFGLSGTNCHVVLEEAPSREEGLREDAGPLQGAPYLVTLSAKSMPALREMARQHLRLLHENPKLPLGDWCYTLNTGREAFSHRLAICFRTADELMDKLCQFSIQDRDRFSKGRAWSGCHKLASDHAARLMNGEITLAQKRGMTEQAEVLLAQGQKLWADVERLSTLCQLFVDGADVSWNVLYPEGRHRRLHLPGYAFHRKSCWVAKQSPSVVDQFSMHEAGVRHPLLNRCLTISLDRMIYESVFTPADHWILHDHIVNGLYVVPGTVYLELITEAVRVSFPHKKLQLKNVLFLSPMIAGREEKREVHTIIKLGPNDPEFVIASRSEEQSPWVIHAEGRIHLEDAISLPKHSVAALKSACTGGSLPVYSYQRGKGIETGLRWDCIKESFFGVDEYLALIGMREEFVEEVSQYNLHPALLDEAVNLALRSVGEELYLPFSYGTVTLCGRLPRTFYTYTRKKTTSGSQREIVVFDILLLDLQGNVLVKIDDYSIKRVHGELQATSKDWAAFDMGWVKSEPQSWEEVDLDAPCLVLKGSTRFAAATVERLKERFKEVIEVSLGHPFVAISRNQYSVDGSEEDFLRLFEAVNDRGISQMVCLQTFTDQAAGQLDGLNEQLERGVYGLFLAVKGLLKAGAVRKLDVVLVGEAAYAVTGREERIQPHHAAWFGLSQVISLEYPKLQCRSIDIDAHTTPEQLLQELLFRSPNPRVALREGIRYTPLLQRVVVEELPEEPVMIRPNGVYVITGGLGGLGLAFAKHLASREAVKLVLMGRTGLPKAETWDALLSDGADAKLAGKIQAIRELEQSGSEVECMSVDIADLCQVQAAIASVRAQYGPIHGVIHAAGVAGNGFLIRKSRETFHQVMAPKVQGTWILDHVTEHDPLDFFVMFSSISAILPEVGQGDYMAANCYLDAYASSRMMRGKKTLSINWPAWNEIGMAVDYEVDMDGDVFQSIGTGQAMAAFDAVLSRRVHKVLLGQINEKQLRQKRGRLPFDVEERLRLEAERKEQSPPPRTMAPGAASDSGSRMLEDRVEAIWSRVLGLPQIDMYESFYDLGGDSILATLLWKELNKEFPDCIDISDIFTHATVMDMAEYIRSKIEPEQPERPEPSKPAEPVKEGLDLDALLEKLASGELSEEEIDQLV